MIASDAPWTGVSLGLPHMHWSISDFCIICDQHQPLQADKGNQSQHRVVLQIGAVVHPLILNKGPYRHLLNRTAHEKAPSWSSF